MKDRTRGLVMGVGAGVLASAAMPFIGPLLRDVLRPLAKTLLKRSLLGVDALRSQVARASEAVEDLLAEVRAEVADERGDGTGAAREESAPPAPEAKAAANKNLS